MGNTDIKRRSNGYWTEEKIIEELGCVISEIHAFPTNTYLRDVNKTYLVTAITRSGGFYKYRSLMGYISTKVPNNYWTEEKIKLDLEDIIRNVGHLPTCKELLNLSKGSLLGAIEKFGGLTKLYIGLSYTPNQKNNYWTIDKVMEGLNEISNKIGRFPTYLDLYNMKRQDLVGQINKYGGINKLRELMGYKQIRMPQGYWNKDIILNKLKEIINKLGYFPSRMDLYNINEPKLYSAICERGGLIKYQKILNIPYDYFRRYKIQLASYVTKRGKNTEKIVYDILCHYCDVRGLVTPKKNTKLAKSNVIEFICNTHKKIGIDVTNCECSSTVYRKWTKKDYYKYLDELWVVVVSDTFKQHHYDKWNKESPDNVYVMSIEDFCNELEYDLEETLKNKIEKYKQCNFHIRNKVSTI